MWKSIWNSPFLCRSQESLHWYYNSCEHLLRHSTRPALPHVLHPVVNKNCFLMTRSTFSARTFKPHTKGSSVIWSSELSSIASHKHHNLKRHLQKYPELFVVVVWATVLMENDDNRKCQPTDTRYNLQVAQRKRDKRRSTQHLFIKHWVALWLQN